MYASGSTHFTQIVQVILSGVLALLVPSCAKKHAQEQPAPESVQRRQQAETTTTVTGVRPKDPTPEIESVDGYRVIRARTTNGNTTAIRIKPPEGWEIIQQPQDPDPHGGKFTLTEASVGLPKQGTLAALIKTSMGTFYCDLFADKAPNTVANFVGLARGLRKFWDSEKLAWVARPYYERTIFHRVIPGFMIQGGDHTGTGRGRIGYTLPDELHPSLHHDKPGQLCMANRGPNTNESQFFITDAAAPHLEGSYSIFGQCEPAALVQRIARVPQSGAPSNTPLTPVTVEHVEIRKLVGGAAKWMPASARLPALPELVPQGTAVQVPAK